MNLVIPVAGKARRFAIAGYTTPKPLIPIWDGIANHPPRPMICHVIDNVRPKRRKCNLIIVALREHYEQLYPVVSFYFRSEKDRVVWLDKATQGALCTVMHTGWYILDEPLIVANGDQLVDVDIDEFLDTAEQFDGSIMTLPGEGDPKYSYARVDAQGYVTEVQEKAPISNYATVGIYYFGSGTDFLAAASLEMGGDDRFGGEFYLAPCFNYLIQAGRKIGHWMIEARDMHGLGTPEDVKIWEESHDRRRNK